MSNHTVSMETIVALAKNRGFVFPGSEMYGGMANSWDYGPLGVELKNNIKRLWWKMFVEERLDMVGLDAALIMSPKVWEASGHLSAGFADPLIECKSCHERIRVDHFLESKGKSWKEEEANLKAVPEAEKDAFVQALFGGCPHCGQKGTFAMPRQFNLMFKTYVGPAEDAASIAYLRPETAQAMFVDFPQILNTSRKRVPFGVAQIGKAFRNEITPGNFIFRQREFEQMEIEYFIHPSIWQEAFEMWLKEMYRFIASCGIDLSRTSNLEVPDLERAHYSKRTVDVEFEYPFGRKELYGLAYRTDFDLSNHAKASGKDIVYTDPITNEKYVPHVVEPSFGVDRTLLAALVSAYDEEKVKDAEGGEDVRVVLRFPAALAPIKIAVLPLSKKDELSSVARPLAERLAKQWRVDYDETQSIGKRYRRQDEIGTPFCVTVDFDSLNDQAVTVRDRDTMKQNRVPMADLEAYFTNKLK